MKNNRNDTFANRLNYAMTIRNIKQAELSRMTGISEPKISCWKSGKYEAKQDGLKILSEVLKVDPVWLMGYDVPINDNSKLDELGNPVVEVPVLGIVKAGYDYLAQENWLGTVKVDKNIADGNELFALEVKGDSMFPTLIEGDIVIIKKQNDFENGDIVVAIIDGNEATIKKGKKSESSILLQPLNTNYEPLIFTKEEMQTIPVLIIGVVKQMKRNF